MHQGAAPIDTSVYSLNTLAPIELGTIAGEYVLMQNEPATVFGLRSGGASTDLSSEVEEIELNLGMLLSAQDDGEKELGVDSFSWRGEGHPRGEKRVGAELLLRGEEGTRE